MPNEPPKRQSGPAPRVSRSQILDAARRYYFEGATQSELARELGVTQGHVTKLLKRARERGWVRITIAAREESPLEEALCARFPALTGARVVPVGESPGARIRALGKALADWFENALERRLSDRPFEETRVSLGGGWVLGHMASLLRRQHHRALVVGPTRVGPAPECRGYPAAQLVATLVADRVGVFDQILEPDFPLFAEPVMFVAPVVSDATNDEAQARRSSFAGTDRTRLDMHWAASSIVVETIESAQRALATDEDRWLAERRLRVEVPSDWAGLCGHFVTADGDEAAPAGVRPLERSMKLSRFSAPGCMRALAVLDAPLAATRSILDAGAATFLAIEESAARELLGLEVADRPKPVLWKRVVPTVESGAIDLTEPRLATFTTSGAWRSPPEDGDAAAHSVVARTAPPRPGGDETKGAGEIRREEAPARSVRPGRGRGRGGPGAQGASHQKTDDL